jgi:hypothetical protein
MWLRRLGPALGFVLLAAALIMVWRQRETVVDALGALKNMTSADLMLHISVLIASVLGNVICTAAMFNLLMRRYGKVGWMEMQSLIAGSTLLNYVPLRPGLFGRVAYHRLYNGIAVTDSFKAILQAIALSSLCVAMLGAIVAASARFGWTVFSLVFVPLVAFLIVAAVTAMVQRARFVSPLACAGAVRYLDLLITAVRYQIAFALIGSPIQFEQAAAFACVAVMATMVPFLSNGLGLREWAVGLAAPVLAATQLELAITADLLIRAAETLMIIPLGLIGIVFLAGLRRQRATHPQQ